MIENKRYLEDIIKYYKTVDIKELHNKSILITGATGLIGSYLIDLIMYANEKDNVNIKVYALSRSKEKLEKRFKKYHNNLNFVEVIQDVNEEINIEQVDYIIHGASNTHPVAYSTDPIGTITTNVFGLYNLLELATKKNIKKFLFLSSVEIYGENNKNIESFEEKDLGYINCNTLRAGYPESKRLGESLCQAYIHKHGINIVIPRISRVYGPTMLSSDTKALSQFINNVINGEDIVLKSEGKQYYSYSYVGDVVQALLLLLTKGINGEAYNISDKNSDIHLKDLAKLIAEQENKKVVFELPNEIEKKGYSTATTAIIDSTKLKELGYKPITPIDEGIPLTIQILKETRK